MAVHGARADLRATARTRRQERDERTTPLLGTKSGDAILLVASKAGAARHPAWFHNVRANPDVAVTIDGERQPMRARVAGNEERERLWAVVCDHYSGYATYQTRTGGRVIPVVVLEPDAGEPLEDDSAATASPGRGA